MIVSYILSYKSWQQGALLRDTLLIRIILIHTLYLRDQHCLVRNNVGFCFCLIFHRVYLSTLNNYQWLSHIYRRWISISWVPCSKPLGDSNVDSDFHPSKVDQVSTRNILLISWNKLLPRSDSVTFRQLNPTHKKRP